jgi:hypothetical protein
MDRYFYFSFNFRPKLNLVDFLLLVGEKGRHHLKSAAVQNELGLVVSAGDNIPNCAQCRRLHFHFVVAQQGDEVLNDLKWKILV